MLEAITAIECLEVREMARRVPMPSARADAIGAKVAWAIRRAQIGTDAGKLETHLELFDHDRADAESAEEKPAQSQDEMNHAMAAMSGLFAASTQGKADPNG